ncbi:MULTISPECIES: hypothetical protein [Flavobacteriaceae]|uniref:Lipoprotein n=2 Tax=Flavobacteriaceae TaxID=49546 RepID=A0A4Y8ASD3_9FLAO|nr:MULTISPECIES: hypothetical protein [Flavobacteriaceae]TEW74110.1 hypothetical protein E2488_11605 [Gramella jeungdoensis]GGK40376.1 hypothetical protein GCM10007963_05550 [Lutibacter litoralis]
MKFLLQNIILLSLFISCTRVNTKYSIPNIKDSIPTTISVLKTQKMLEGGYDLIGIEEIGKPFEIKNLKKKNDDYLIKTIIYNDSTQSVLEYEEEIIEIDDLELADIEKPIESNPNETSYELGNNDLRIYVDTTQILNMPNYKDNLELNENLQTKSSDILEYSNLVKNSYSKYYRESNDLKQAYPILIFNQSRLTIPINLKEGWVMMIQEAKDKEGEWKPIEYYEPFVICGNSFWSDILLPNHYAISKIYKYGGQFKTISRVKLLTNDKIYYSNEFNSFINEEQFSLPDYIKSKEKRNHHFFMIDS